MTAWRTGFSRVETGDRKSTWVGEDLGRTRMGCNKIFHLLSVKYLEIQITKRILPSSLRVCYQYLGEVTDAFNVICK